MLLRWLSNIFGDSNEKKIKMLSPLLEQINSFEPQMKELSDQQLKDKTTQLKEIIKEGKTLDDILPEAFALVREASVRTIGLRHFDVQVIGGIVLHQGKIAEMKTGEGKTLAATLPIYLNALMGKGAHVVTVNDYLARRDAEWMRPIYQALGLEVGIIQNNMEPDERRQAYAADITYGTNNEFGFDYLRDNMAISIEDCVQRKPYYAIVDEVDSILIDEARTPLIISGMVEDSVASYMKANTLVKRLVKDSDFTIDEKTKNAVLTEMGVKKAEKLLGVEYLFDVKNMEIAHQTIQSLKAWHLFKRDIDYVIKEGEILIVDEFTGRLMVGRRYSDGLHQAIEAKEGVTIREESQTLATITFQNYFRLYNKLAGMTGTAKTEEDEFWKIYKLEVMVIPTNQPMIRLDHSDVIYKSKKAKFKAVADEIEKLHKEGRPVLVGTVSIEHSELLSMMLKRRNVSHHVLNAKQHAREAEIIARAGEPGQVTIATNMAGRGTDIVLGEGIAEKGGLHVIGTERHESRRIDNQLRGRSGRQGDKGSSRFYVALEDDLMRLFGADRITGMMNRLGMEEDMPIAHNLVSNAIERAQKKVEQYHFSIRKQVLEFDDVMNKQRETIYTLRRRILEGENLKQKVFEMIDSVVDQLVDQYLPKGNSFDPENIEILQKAVIENIPIMGLSNLEEIKNQDQIKDALKENIKKSYDQREDQITPENMRQLERLVMLRVIDTKWIEQLHNMDNLKEGIGLRAYGQRDPLIEYKIEGYGMFQEMMQAARQEIIGMILKVQIVEKSEMPTRSTQITNYSGPEETAPSIRKDSKKVGRNDPCPCGSGKKYKKCCLLKEKA